MEKEIKTDISFMVVLIVIKIRKRFSWESYLLLWLYVKYGDEEDFDDLFMAELRWNGFCALFFPPSLLLF